MADKRIIELEERLTLSDGDYFATDNTNGTCKVNAKILLDRFSDDEDAIATKAAKVDLTNISITGSTNNTGSTIASGTYFYKDGTLVKAIAAIANGATLTLNTNYEIVTAGGLNDLNEALSDENFVYLANVTTSGASVTNIDYTLYKELLFIPYSDVTGGDKYTREMKKLSKNLLSLLKSLTTGTSYLQIYQGSSSTATFNIQSGLINIDTNNKVNVYLINITGMLIYGRN